MGQPAICSGDRHMVLYVSTKGSQISEISMYRKVAAALVEDSQGNLRQGTNRWERCVRMRKNWAEWAFGYRKPEKSGDRMAAEINLFPRRWYGDTVSTNLKVIWEITVKDEFQSVHPLKIIQVPAISATFK